jgi:L-lactate dehydrogenase
MKKNIDLKKVVLVGTGFVGMSMAYSMLNTGGVDELVLVDVDKEKTIGEAMDLSHGLPYAQSKMKIKAGDYIDCKDADVVVITAGAAQKEGQTRLELTAINAKITKSITEQVMASGFDGIIVVAGNPVDLMAYVAYKVSGLPANRVIGSGTILDTARLRYAIGEYLNISSANVHAYILGEHGDTSFVPWMNAYIGTKSLMEYVVEHKENMDELHKIYIGVQQAAYEIISRKKATYYGIGLSLNRLVQAILNDEDSIFTVSVYQQGEYIEEDLYIGVPAVINRNGIREIINLNLNNNDKKKFLHSCSTLKEIIDNEIKPIL